MSHKRTNDLRKRLTWLRILSYSLCLVPSLIFIIIGFANSSVRQKLILSSTTFMVIGVTIFNLVNNKLHLRGWIFILIVVLHNILSGQFMTFLVIFTGGYCLDEIAISPLIFRTKQQLIVNKEIDKRE